MRGFPSVDDPTHTPGPWKFSTTRGTIETLEGVCLFMVRSPTPQGFADATLGAAAPALLDALADLLEHVVGWPRLTDDDLRVEDALGNDYARYILAARAAIKQAREP